jgi:predicted transcriptional regulator
MLPELDTIKLRRRALGLSQRRLAELSGVSQGTIAKIEGRKIIPGYMIAKNVFDVLEKMGMHEERKARDIMNGISFVSPGDSVKKAMVAMVRKGFSQLPVVKDGRTVGSMSEKLLLDVKDRSVPCSDVMGPPFVTVDESAPLSLVRDILKLEDALLVVKGEKLVGIVTKSDLLR